MTTDKIVYDVLVDKFKYNQRMENDVHNFLNAIKNYTNSNLRYILQGPDKKRDENDRLHGFKLFPLNILITKGKTRDKSLKAPTSPENLYKNTFIGFCLELETIVSLVMWLGSENKYTDKHIELSQDIEKNIINSVPTYLSISGNYLLGDGHNNYSHILVYRSTYEFFEKDEFFSNWGYMPFLKRSSETIIAYFSPRFSPIVFENNIDAYENYFVAVIKYVSNVNKNSFKLNILNHFFSNGQIDQELDVFIYNPELITNLQKYSFDTDTYLLGLFKDKVYTIDNKNYRHEIILDDILIDTTAEDILYHKLMQRIYYNYLVTTNLYICNINKLEEIYNKECYLLSKIKVFVNCNFNLFFKLYLQKYLIMIDNNIYYRPHLLNSYNKDKLRVIYDSYLIESKSMEPPDNLNEMQIVFNLVFLNIYNQYSKQTLINRIKMWDNKWIINT